MAEVVIKSRFVIRRGKLEEWNRVNPIPYDGEPCFAEDANILKVGNGISTWKELDVVNASQFSGTMLRGYYYRGDFYTDSTYQTKLEYDEKYLYVDNNLHGTLFTYNGEEFERCVTIASEESAGIMKLYNQTGVNIDGTMTQKSITDNLADKMKASIDGEYIIFS